MNTSQNPFATDVSSSPAAAAPAGNAPNTKTSPDAKNSLPNRPLKRKRQIISSTDDTTKSDASHHSKRPNRKNISNWSDSLVSSENSVKTITSDSDTDSDEESMSLLVRNGTEGVVELGAPKLQKKTIHSKSKASDATQESSAAASDSVEKQNTASSSSASSKSSSSEKSYRISNTHFEFHSSGCQVIEESRSFDFRSLQPLSQLQVDKNENTLEHIKHPTKVLLNSPSKNCKIDNLKISVQEGLQFDAYVVGKKPGKHHIHINRDYLKEKLTEVFLTAKPVVVVLGFREVVPQISYLRPDVKASPGGIFRLFIRLVPQDYPSEGINRLVTILKTILLGVRENQTSASDAAVSIRFIHNDKMISLLKLQASSLSEVDHKDNSNLPPDKRPVFNISKLKITLADIKRLDPRQFLNDNIVDYYMMEIFESLSPELQERCHFFNSQFYPLVSHHAERAAKRVPHPSSVDIFKKDFLFIPICRNLHWTLCILCYPRNAGSKVEREEAAHFEYCDSLGVTQSDAVDSIRKYLRLRWKVEHPGSGPKFFSPNSFPFHASVLPKQNNNCDCGVFMLYYIEKFLEQIPELPLKESDWFTQQDVKRKRELIRSKARKRHRLYMQTEENTNKVLF